jgi:hypothetical protein
MTGFVTADPLSHDPSHIIGAVAGPAKMKTPRTRGAEAASVDTQSRDKRV